MDEFKSTVPLNHDDADTFDLARRLARYRRRVEAEARPRSVRFIDRAIQDADKKLNGSE